MAHPHSQYPRQSLCSEKSGASDISRRLSLAAGALLMRPELVSGVDIVDLSSSDSESLDGNNLETAGGFDRLVSLEKEADAVFAFDTPLRGRAFFLFPCTSAFRLSCARLVNSKAWKLSLRTLTWASTVSLLAISRKTHGKPQSAVQSAFIAADWAVVGFFLFDTFLNCVSWGCLLVSKKERREAANYTYLGGRLSHRMELAVMLLSIGFMSVGLHGLHCLRMLRCLPHTYFPEMRSARAVFQAVERSASLLIDNLSILCFFIIFFSICAVEFFAGGHAFSCVIHASGYPSYINDTTASGDLWPVDNLYCSQEQHSLFPAQPCPQEPRMSCIDVGNPDPAWLNFDNFGTASVAIFQIVQLENWGEIMRPLLRSRSTQFTYFFFVVLILVCRFVVINLFIAIIVFHFQEIQVQMAGEDPDFILARSTSQKLVLDAASWLPTSAAPWLERRFPWAFQAIAAPPDAGDTSNGGSLTDAGSTEKRGETEEGVDTVEMDCLGGTEDKTSKNGGSASSHDHEGDQGVTEGTGDEGSRADKAFRLMERRFMPLVLVVSTGVQAMWHDEAGEELKDFLRTAEYAFLTIFTLEQCIRFAYDREGFVDRRSWQFDLLVLVGSFVALADEKSLQFLSRMRVFRFLATSRRLSDFARRVRVEPLVSLFYMMIMVMFLFSIVGMQFFSGLYTLASEKETNVWLSELWRGRLHFETFGGAMQTLFIVMAGDNWSYPLYEAMGVGGSEFFPSVFFFYSFIVCSNWVLLSVFIAVLLQEFDTFSPLEQSLENHEIVTQSRSLFSTFLRRVDMADAANDVDAENVTSVCAIVNMHKWAARAKETKLQRAYFKKKLILTGDEIAESAQLLEGRNVATSLRSCIKTIQKTRGTETNKGVNRLRKAIDRSTRQAKLVQLLGTAVKAEHSITSNVNHVEQQLLLLQTKPKMPLATQAKLRMLTSAARGDLAQLKKRPSLLQINGIPEIERDPDCLSAGYLSSDSSSSSSSVAFSFRQPSLSHSDQQQPEFDYPDSQSGQTRRSSRASLPDAQRTPSKPLASWPLPDLAAGKVAVRQAMPRRRSRLNHAPPLRAVAAALLRQGPPSTAVGKGEAGVKTPPPQGGSPQKGSWSRLSVEGTAEQNDNKPGSPRSSPAGSLRSCASRRRRENRLDVDTENAGEQKGLGKTVSWKAILEDRPGSDVKGAPATHADTPPTPAAQPNDQTRVPPDAPQGGHDHASPADGGAEQQPRDAHPARSAGGGVRELARNLAAAAEKLREAAPGAPQAAEAGFWGGGPGECPSRPPAGDDEELLASDGSEAASDGRPGAAPATAAGFAAEKVSARFTAVAAGAAAPRRAKRKRWKSLSLFVFPEGHPVREGALQICHSAYFNRSILFAVLASSLTVLFSPAGEAWGDSSMHVSATGSLPAEVDAVLNVFFLCVFTAEFLVKITAFGFVWMSRPKDLSRRHDKAYLLDLWNCLDFTILLLMYLSFTLDLVQVGNAGIQSIRIFRVLRVIRVIRRVPSLKRLLQALLHPQTLVRIGIVLVIALFCYFSFGLVAVSLFSGRLGSCSSGLAVNKTECVTGWSSEDTFVVPVDDPSTYQNPERYAWPPGSSVSPRGAVPGYLAPRAWVAPWRNFDTIGSAVITLITVASGEDWATPMFRTVDSTAPSSGPARGGNPQFAVFFVLYMFVMSFVIVNLVIFVITDAIRRQSGTAILLREQVEWIDLMHYIKVTRPLPWVPAPGKTADGELTLFGAVRATLLRHAGPKPWCKNRGFDLFINFVILINILMMTTEYRGMSATHTTVLETANSVIIGIYVVECLLRIVAFTPKAYFKDKWNRFDSFIALGAVVGLLLTPVSEGSNPAVVSRLFSVVRIFRILRIFKMIRRFKGVAFLFDSLLASLPAIGNIVLIVVLFMWVWGALGTEVFGSIRLRGAINADMNFRSFFNTFCTLTTVITLDDWINVMNDARTEPPFCSTLPPPYVGALDGGIDADLSLGYNDCGSKLAAAVYFISFFVLGGYIFLNVVTAAILDEVQHAISRDRFRVSEKEIDDFKVVWSNTVQGNASDCPRWRMAHLMEALFFRNKLGLHPLYHKKFFHTFLLKLDWFKLRHLCKRASVTRKKTRSVNIDLWPPPVWETYRFHEVLHVLCHHAYEDVALDLDEVEANRQFQRKAERLLATQVLQSVIRTMCCLHLLERDRYPFIIMTTEQKQFMRSCRQRIRSWKEATARRFESGVCLRRRLFLLPDVLQKVDAVEDGVHQQEDLDCRMELVRGFAEAATPPEE
ncbi:Voltage-dependent calcium channel type A subunit alpha-1 [Diplonema papillatum]|nr:Voltage-dependent calcium channel type A subunit alpha-1 [Diplonema papillatum]|eukprot:gene9714-15084_t